MRGVGGAVTGEPDAASPVGSDEVTIFVVNFRDCLFPGDDDGGRKVPLRGRHGAAFSHGGGFVWHNSPPCRPRYNAGRTGNPYTGVRKLNLQFTVMAEHCKNS